MENIVEVFELRKKFGEVEAIRSINFHMKKGEILGLLGPNGAGKTTTLHMLLGLTTPTSGQINVLGFDATKRDEEMLKRLNFSSSYVALPYSLTVVENLTVFARLYEVPNYKEKINSLIEIFDIEDIRFEPTRRLSSGQVTRVSLAKALLNDPEVLFLDEPTASLDPDIADKTRTLLKNLNKTKGLSILYTSHNMNEMENLCDRVILLDKGEIKAYGTIDEILEEFKEKTLEEVFLKVARA